MKQISVEQHFSRNSLQTWLPLIVKFIKILAAIGALMHIIGVLFICLSRLSYPYELEWIEGSSLVQLNRILNGLPLYTPLSINNVPVVYMPLYYYISAFFAKITGLSFTPLRTVSFLSSLGIGLMVFFAVKKSTNEILPSLIATAIFAAAFHLTGGWYDLARPDMLAVFFTFAALLTLRSEKRIFVLASGALFAISLFTKQTMLPYFVLALSHTLIFESNKFFRLCLSFLIVLACGGMIVLSQNPEWFYYYIFVVPANHIFEITYETITQVPRVLIIPLPFVMLALLVSLFSNPREVLNHPDNRYYWLIAGVTTVSGLTLLLSRGGSLNSFAPAFTSYAILFGIGFNILTKKNVGQKNPLVPQLYLILLWLGCFVQFYLLAYNPLTQIPSDVDLRTGDQLVSRISAFHGNVLIPQQNYLALYAGKAPFFNEIALKQIRGTFSQNPMKEWKDLKIQIQESIRNHQFTAIILDAPDKNIENLLGCFQKELIEYESDDTFMPIEGGASRPKVIYTLCQN